MNPAYLRCVLALDHLLLAACGLWLALAAAPAPAAELWIGAATADITPDRPVPLTGNTSARIGREIQSRLTANILALESRDGERSLDQAILIACDLCVIRPGIQEGFRKQKGAGKTYEMELHMLRLGDVAIATSPFELFLDYGVQIEARSPAVQTFLIPLAGAGREHAYYLPTPRAIAGGALDDKPFTNYSATVMNNRVGREGGQVLVDRTVETIRELWKW